MASPGQRRGTCGHAMALFDTHTKCARCRDKGVGQDDCVLKKDCTICNSLTAEQKLQLATPTYKARKEKELQKKATSPSLVDPSTVSVIGKVESAKGDSGDRGETPKKKKTSHKSPKKTSKPPKAPDFQSDLKNMDEKWSERFTRLEALFLSKTFQLPVEPVQSSNVVVSEKPFIPPVELSAHQSPATGVSGKKKKSATQPVEAPGAKKLATQPIEAPGAGVDPQLTDQAAFSSAAASTSGRPEVQPPGPTTQPPTTDQPEEVSSEEDQFSDQPELSLDEGELSEVLSVGQDREELTETDQELSSEQTYRETLRGVRSFMGWEQVPEFDSSSSAQDDNPFAGTKPHLPGKVSLKVPVDDWLCRKFEKLNITIQEGYPSRASETSGLVKDQFVKPPRTLKWYDMHTEKKEFSRSKVTSWTNQPARLNSSFPRIANRSLPSAPASRPVTQDTLRKWERAARDQTYMCNQAAAFSRCLTKVQDSMASQLKILQNDKGKGKATGKSHQAVEELDFLITFNKSISQAMARTMQDLSEGVFINVANLTLTRRDSYLDYLKAGIKQDTLNALRSAPLHMSALFPDHLISKAEEEIRHHEEKRTPGSSHKGSHRFHPYQATKQQQPEQERKPGLPAWKQLGRRRGQRSHRGRTASFVQRPAKTQKQYK